MARDGKIIRLEIDLSDTCGCVDNEEDEIIQTGLKSAGVFSEDFLYSVFNGARVAQVERTGQYRHPGSEHPNSIFAFAFDELVWEGKPGDSCDIETYARNYSPAGLIVYRADHLARVADQGDKRLLFEYEFVHPDRKVDAVEAIALIRLPGVRR